jgi:hypothetical protein
MEQDTSAMPVTNRDLEPLLQELASLKSELKHELDAQLFKMTIRPGLMLFLGLGLTIAMLRLWSG